MDRPLDGKAASGGGTGTLRRAIGGAFAYPATGPLLAFLAIFALFSTLTDTFFNAANVSLVIQQSVVIGTLALGQTLIVLIAGIDLACSAILVFGIVVAGQHAVAGDPFVALLLGFSVCLACAAVNGLLVTRFNLPPFIATLGMLAILTATARLYTGMASYPINSKLLLILGEGPSYGDVTVTYGSMLWIALSLGLGYALTQTAWGVWVYAIGNSRSAARLNGIGIRGTVFGVYTLAGAFYALAAWQAMGRTPIADPSGYQTANLDSITAVVIGGTSLFGGRGGVAGSVIGALIVSVLKNGLTQAGIDSLYQQIGTGILVILAVGADQYLGRGQRPS